MTNEFKIMGSPLADCTDSETPEAVDVHCIIHSQEISQTSKQTLRTQEVDQWLPVAPHGEQERALLLLKT